MERIPDRGLTPSELVAFNYFDSQTMPVPKGLKSKLVPKMWLLHASYILTNLSSLALGFCEGDPHGKVPELLWQSVIVFSFHIISCIL